MMKLKIIVHDGLCRGRPPTRGDTRDGPGSVGQLDSWTVGQLDSWTVGQLDGWTVKMKHETRNPNPVTRIARDWINYTCSVNLVIAQDRHKHRLRSPGRLIEIRPTGRDLPGFNAWGLGPGAYGLRLVACGLWLAACGLRLAACGLWLEAT